MVKGETAAKPESVEKEEKPALMGFRFRGPYNRAVVFGVIPARQKQWNEGPIIRKETIPGVYLVTDGRGETGPVADPRIIRWYLANQKYHGELVPVCPGVTKPGLPKGQMRDIGTDLTDWERKELEKLADYMEKHASR